MQLDNAAILPLLEADVLSAWSAAQIRLDMQKTQNAADQLPKARIEMLPWLPEATGGGVSAKECKIPHIFAITGTFAYPDSGTILEAASERWNQLVALLTTEQPYYHDLWTYNEQIGGEYDDDPTERTYSVTVTFTLNVISPVKIIGIGP